MTSPVASEPASQGTLPPVIWALLHAMTEPEAYAITFRRTGKTPELWIKPITDCNKVRG